MNLIQQLAEYQNAPIASLEAAKKGANPNISPWVAGAILSDRIEKEKRMAMGQGAAQGPMPTVDEQQDQEVAGIMGALHAPQAQPAQAAPAQRGPVMAAEGGLMSARVNPDMFNYSGGGIIAFSGEDGDQQVPEVATTEAGDAMRALWRAIIDPLEEGGREKMREREKNLALAKNEPGMFEALTPSQRKAREAKRAEIEAQYAPKAAPQPAPRPEAADLRKLDSAMADIAAATPSKAPPKAPAAAPSGAPRAPAAGGIMSLGPVQKAVTSAPEWATMEAARKKEFEAPKMGTTAGELAAEKAAHLKAQGITKRPWETASEQTAELRRLMSSEDEARKKDLADRETDERYRTFVANLGGGSFGQSAGAGLRANIKREEGLRAEEQRIKELRYNQKLKLNEIDSKAEEMRYNEAIGDVAAAQKNRQEIAALKRQYEKDQSAIAKDQATLRQLAASNDAQNATTLAAARERMGASQNLTPKQIADIRDKAYDNVAKRFEARGIAGIQMQQARQKDPGLFDRMVQQETERLLAQMGASPVQSQIGPPPEGAVRRVK